jgi:hypothetical protein
MALELEMYSEFGRILNYLERQFQMKSVKCAFFGLFFIVLFTIPIFSQARATSIEQQIFEELIPTLGKGGCGITGRTDLSIGTIAFKLSDGSIERRRVTPFAMGGWGVIAEAWRIVIETQFITGAIPQLSSYPQLEALGFATNIGYKIIDNQRWNVYPFVGFGAERIRNQNGELPNTSTQVGLGMSYFLPLYTSPENLRYSIAPSIVANIQLAYQHRFVIGYVPENIDVGSNLTLRLQVGIGLWWQAKRYEDVAQ